MTRNEDTRTGSVEDMLADARNNQASVPTALVRRVLDDAARVQPVAQPTARRRMRFPLLRWPRFQLVSACGGLVTAGVLGFWLGVSPPDALEDLDILGADLWEPIYTGDATELSGFGWDTGEI